MATLITEILVKLGLDTSGLAGQATKASESIQGVGKAAKESGSVFSSAMEGIAHAAGISTEALGLLGKAAAGLGVGLGVTKAVEFFVESGIEAQKTMGQLAADTGTAGKALDELKGTVDDLATTMAVDEKAAADAVTLVTTRLGEQGDAAKETAGLLLRLTQIDPAVNFQDATRILQGFNVAVEDQAKVMNVLLAVHQQTGASLSGLISTVATGGASFRELGLSVEQAAGFLGLIEKAGGDSSQVLFGLRSAVAGLARDGEQLPAAFKRALEELQSMEDQSKRTARAVELFSKSGAAIANAMAAGKFNLDEFTASLEHNQASVEAAGKGTESLWGATKRLGSSLGQLAEAFGGLEIANAARALIGGAAGVVNAVRGIEESQQSAIGTAVDFAFALITGGTAATKAAKGLGTIDKATEATSKKIEELRKDFATLGERVPIPPIEVTVQPITVPPIPAVTVPVTADTTTAREQMAQLQKVEPIDIPANIDAKSAQQQLGTLFKTGTTVTIPVGLDSSEAETKFTRTLDRIDSEAAKGSDIKMDLTTTVHGDTAPLKKDVTQTVAELERERHVVTIEGDADTIPPNVLQTVEGIDIPKLPIQGDPAPIQEVIAEIVNLTPVVTVTFETDKSKLSEGITAALADAENATKGLGKINLGDFGREIQGALAGIAVQAQALGPSFQSSQATLQVMTKIITTLGAAGVDSFTAIATAEKIAGASFDDLKAKAADEAITKQFKAAAEQAKAFGTDVKEVSANLQAFAPNLAPTLEASSRSFAQIQQQIAKTTAEIKAFTEQGIGAADPRVKALSASLDQLKARGDVQLKLDTAGIAEQLQAVTAEIAAGKVPPVKMQADTAAITEAIKFVKDELAKLPQTPTTIAIALQLEGMEQLNALNQQLALTRQNSTQTTAAFLQMIPPEVKKQYTDLTGTLVAFQSTVQTMSPAIQQANAELANFKPANVTTPEIEKLTAKLNELKTSGTGTAAEITALGGKIAQLKTDEAQRQLEQLQAKKKEAAEPIVLEASADVSGIMDRISSLNVQVQQGIDPIEFKAKDDALRASLALVKKLIDDTLPPEIAVEVDAKIDKAAAKLTEVEAAATKQATKPIDADTSAAQKKIAELQAQAEQAIGVVAHGGGAITGNAASRDELEKIVAQAGKDVAAAIAAGDTAKLELIAGDLKAFRASFGTFQGQSTIPDDIKQPLAQLEAATAGFGLFAKGNQNLSSIISSELTNARLEASKKADANKAELQKQTQLQGVQKDQGSVANTELRAQTASGVRIAAGVEGLAAKDCCHDPVELTPASSQAVTRASTQTASSVDKLAAGIDAQVRATDRRVDTPLKLAASDLLALKSGVASRPGLSQDAAINRQRETVSTLAAERAASRDTSLRTPGGLKEWAQMIAHDTAAAVRGNISFGRLEAVMSEVGSRVSALNTEIGKTADAALQQTAATKSVASSAARTATATEQIATTFRTGRFGGTAMTSVQQTAQRSTGSRSSVFK